MTIFPQLRLLSTNECPCGSNGLTTFGYCGLCWASTSLIPSSWQTRVEAELERINQ